MVAAHIINENRPAYNLKYLTKEILKISMTTFKSLGIYLGEGDCPAGLYPHFGFLPMEVPAVRVC